MLTDDDVTDLETVKVHNSRSAKLHESSLQKIQLN